MTNKEAVAKLQAAGDIAIAAGCELAKIPAMDVLAIADLLTEQEPVRWLKISPAGIYECSGCGQIVLTSDIEAYRFCHGCGRKVKWDG